MGQLWQAANRSSPGYGARERGYRYGFGAGFFGASYLMLWVATYFAFTSEGIAKTEPTYLWYGFPIFLAILGGITVYNAVRKVDETMAKRLLILGLG